MNNYREKMKEYLKEPDEHSSQYGKWCALNNEQRVMIRRLLDEMDRADVYIRSMFEEKQDLIKYLEDKIEDLLNRILAGLYVSKDKLNAYQEILDKIKEDNYEKSDD